MQSSLLQVSNKANTSICKVVRLDRENLELRSPFGSSTKRQNGSRDTICSYCHLFVGNFLKAKPESLRRLHGSKGRKIALSPSTFQSLERESGKTSAA